jgi:hypothetical protein
MGCWQRTADPILNKQNISKERKISTHQEALRRDSQADYASSLMGQTQFLSST